MAEVRIVDLPIIKRFSLAVRREFADADDVLEALDDSRAEVKRVLRREGSGSASRATSPKPKAPPKKASAKRPPARKTAAKSAATKPPPKPSSMRTRR